MKIRSLTLENVRKFGGKRVSIGQIGDGITVVSEANEFGKSTFFDALYALYFEKYTATGKSVQSLRPHAGGGVRIQSQVDIDGVGYEIEKRFLSQKGASVTALADRRVIARDGEAENWIARHIGAADQGPAGLLWVRQGVVGLEPADGGRTEKDRLTEARRDLLSSVAGEIDQVTGGRTLDRILRRCQEDLNQLATGKTLLPRGQWKDAAEDEKQLLAELEQLQRQCADLSGALSARRTLEAELKRLDDPAEKTRREADLQGARAASQAAEAYAQKVTAAARDLEIARLHLGEAERAYGEQVEAESSAVKSLISLDEAQERRGRAKAALRGERETEQQSRADFAAAEVTTKQLRAELALVGRAARAQQAQDDVARVQKTLEQARQHTALRAEAMARVSDNPATPSALMGAEQAVSEANRLRGAVTARAAHMTVRYSGDLRVSSANGPLLEGVSVKIEDAAKLDLPGIGQLSFELPRDSSDEALAAEVASGIAAEASALEICGASALASARIKAQDRQADENKVKLADELLLSLAPSGIEALEQALAEGKEDMNSAPDIKLRPAAEIASDLEDAVQEEAASRARLENISERVGIAREEHAAADAAQMAAQDQKDKADGVAGEVGTRNMRQAHLKAAAQTAGAEAAKLSEALVVVTAQAPDVATAAANLRRAETAFDAARNRREQLAERRADLSARIETRAEEGIEERREEVADRVKAVQERTARYAAEVASLAHLRNVLEAARDNAREAYFDPVQSELRPLLRILHEDAGLDWETDTIVPGALRRGGAVEAFDTLSGGTQEQIAILTRLAFARLFARRGQHLPIILDDALVYSDDDRIVKMFTALNRVAMDQQIIVFSCRQLAFAGLGGERPIISIKEIT